MGVLNTYAGFVLQRQPTPSFQATLFQEGCKWRRRERTFSTLAGSRARPPFRNVLPAAEEIRRVVPVIEALKQAIEDSDLNRHIQG